MSQIEAAESEEHEELKKQLKYKFRKMGYDKVYQQKEFYGYKPDLRAYSSKKRLIPVIGEAKRCEDLDDPETFKKFKIYSNFYVDEAKTVLIPLYIRVPKECIDKLKEKLSQDKELSKKLSKSIFIDP